MDIKTLLEDLIEDEEFLNALSEVGVFISNYHTGVNLSSHVWKNVPESFNLEYKESGFLDMIHPEDRETVRKALDEITRGKCKTFHEIYRMRTHSGEYRWVFSKGRAVGDDEDGNTHLFVGSDRDITVLKETESKLRESAAKEKQRSDELEILRQISASINSMMDMNELIHLTLEEIKRIIPFDCGSVQVLRESKLNVVGAVGFAHPEKVMALSFNFPQSGSLSTRAIQEGMPFFSNDVAQDFPAFTQPDPSSTICSWIGVPLISHGNNIGLIALDGLQKGQFNSHHMELAGIIGDQIAMAMERSMLHEEAYSMAMTDSLTALGSRHRLDLEGRLLFETAIRNKTYISLALLDIDHFKHVNDRYGHDEGDNVLKKIATVCKEAIRGMDSIFRFGGEEFVLILPETAPGQALPVLDRLRETVGSIDHPGIEGRVTISVGFCSGIPEYSQSLENYLGWADKALYQSKENGRNRVTECRSPLDGKECCEVSDEWTEQK